VGDLLQYSVLEMSLRGQPRVAPLRLSLLAALDGGLATLVPWPEAALRHASLAPAPEEALALAGCGEEEEAEAREAALEALPGAPYAPDFSLHVQLVELSSVRVFHFGDGAEEEQQPPAPAAASAEAAAEEQFKAAARALAEARRAQAAAAPAPAAGRAAGSGWRKGSGVGSLLARLRRESDEAA